MLGWMSSPALGQRCPAVAVASCDAIVLPISLYMRHLEEWPAQAKIMLLAPSNQEGQLPAHDDRVVFLGSKKAPLGNLLDVLGQACTNLAQRPRQSTFSPGKPQASASELKRAERRLASLNSRRSAVEPLRPLFLHFHPHFAQLTLILFLIVVFFLSLVC